MLDFQPLLNGATDPQVLSAATGVIGTAVGAIIANRHTLAVADRERAYKIANEEADAFQGRLASLDHMKGSLLSTHQERRHDARQRRQGDWIKGSFFFQNAESARSSMRSLTARIPSHPLLPDLAALSDELIAILEDSGKFYGQGVESESDLDEIERRTREWDGRAADLEHRAADYHEGVRQRFLPRTWRDRFKRVRC